MKVIFKNCSVEYQNVKWNVLEKIETNVKVTSLANFTDIRESKSVTIRVKVIDKGSWDKDTIPFSLSKGDSSVLTAVHAYIGEKIQYPTNSSGYIKLSQKFNFADTDIFPDDMALKFSVETTNYDDGLKANTIKYRVEYVFL